LRPTEFLKDKIHRLWSKPVRPMMMLVPTLILAVLIIGGSTFAWFISNDGERNKFAAGKQKLRIEAVDEFTPPSTAVMPGDSFPKTVGAKNTGDLPGFARVLVSPTIFANDNTGATPLPAGIGQEVLLNIDTANWKLGEDGYYYYMGLLQPGQSAPPLFTQVELPSVLDELYNSATMKIEIKVEGVDYYTYKEGLSTRYHFRDAFWADPTDAPPATLPALRDIDSTFAGLAR
jgi:hypothetical protein